MPDWSNEGNLVTTAVYAWLRQFIRLHLAVIDEWSTGATEEQVKFALGLSKHAYELIRSQIFDAVGTRNKAAAVADALKHGVKLRGPIPNRKYKST